MYQPGNEDSKRRAGKNIGEVMDTVIHPRECDEGSNSESRNAPFSVGQVQAHRRVEGGAGMSRGEGEAAGMLDDQLQSQCVHRADAGKQMLQDSFAEDAAHCKGKQHQDSMFAVLFCKAEDQSDGDPEKPFFSKMGDEDHDRIQNRVPKIFRDPGNDSGVQTIKPF